MKIELSQRAPGGRRPAWSVAAWLRVLVLSLICAGVGLLWSSSSASADTAPDSGTSLASGTHALGQGLARTGTELLGTHHRDQPVVSRAADGRPAAKPADGGAAAADHAVASPVPARQHSASEHAPSAPKHAVIRHPVIKHRVIKQPVTRHPVTRQPVIKHPVTRQPVIKQAESRQAELRQPELKQPVIKQPDSRQPDTKQAGGKVPEPAGHPHRAKSVAPTDAADTAIDDVTDAVDTTVHSTFGSVHGISSRVGSTADPVGRAGHQDHDARKVGAVTTPVADVTDSAGGVVHSVAGTTDAVGSAVDDTTGIVDGVAAPDRLGSATGAEIPRASGIVHAGDDVVRSTGTLVGSTGRTVAALGGDRSEPLGSVVGTLVGTVGDTVTGVGSTVDGLGRVADDLDTTVATAVNLTVTRTIDHTVGTTIGSTPIVAITETITNTVSRTVGDTITGVNGVAGMTISDTGATIEPITSVLQPLGQADSDPAGAVDPYQEPGLVPQTTTAGQPVVASLPAHHSSTAALIVSAPVVSWLAPQVVPSPIAEETASSETNARPAKMFATPQLGLGGGPVPPPGQPPQPTGEMITASSSGGTWQEHAVLRSANNRATGKLLHSRRSWSAQPQATPYDPGYSPD